MSRRARKYQPRPVHSNAMQIALARVKPLTAADVAGQTALVQNALQQFCQGINCDAHWCRLADTANMGSALGMAGGKRGNVSGTFFHAIARADA